MRTIRRIILLIPVAFVVLTSGCASADCRTARDLREQVQSYTGTWWQSDQQQLLVAASEAVVAVECGTKPPAEVLSVAPPLDALEAAIEESR